MTQMNGPRWFGITLPPDAPNHPLSTRQRAAIRRQIHGMPNDATAEVRNGDSSYKVPVGFLRSLLGAEQQNAEQPPRVSLTDREQRVTYVVTIGRGVGKVWLRNLDVYPEDDQPDPKVFRVPAQTLAQRAAMLLAEMDTYDDPHQTVVFGDATDTGRRGQDAADKSPEGLFRLLSEGHTRRTLPKRLKVTQGRVDELLRLARKERPDLAWPARTRGPNPKTPDGEQTAGSTERKNR